MAIEDIKIMRRQQGIYLKNEEAKKMKIMIKDIEPNKFVDSIFVLDSFEVRRDKNEKEYVLLNLRDKTGLIKAFIWNASRPSCEKLTRKTLLNITGYSRRFENTLIIDVYDWRYVKWNEVEIGDFIEVVKEGINHWYLKLMELINLIENPCCRALIEMFISDEAHLSKIIFRRKPL